MTNTIGWYLAVLTVLGVGSVVSTAAPRYSDASPEIGVRALTTTVELTETGGLAT